MGETVTQHFHDFWMFGPLETCSYGFENTESLQRIQEQIQETLLQVVFLIFLDWGSSQSGKFWKDWAHHK